MSTASVNAQRHPDPAPSGVTSGREDDRPTGPPASSVRRGTVSTRSAVFVVPGRRGNGYRASIRGHVLELADPRSTLAPTPEDLLVVAVASDAAWSARSFLRGRGLDEELSVSAGLTPPESVGASPCVDVTVTVPRETARLMPALGDALRGGLAARLLGAPVRLEVRVE